MHEKIARIVTACLITLMVIISSSQMDFRLPFVCTRHLHLVYPAHRSRRRPSGAATAARTRSTSLVRSSCFSTRLVLCTRVGTEPHKNTHNIVPEKNHQSICKSQEPSQNPTTPTENTKRKACPHRSLVRLELCCRRRVIGSLVHGDAKAARLRPERPVEDDRGHAEADRGPDLRHRRPGIARLQRSVRSAAIPWRWTSSRRRT
jgi:hypothetical protein